MKTDTKILMEVFMEKAEKLGYSIRVFDADRKTFEISKNGKSVFTIGKHFPFNSHAAFEIVKRKDLTKQIFREKNFPTPAGILTDNWERVESALENKEINFPLVAKPNSELGGKLVIAKINDKKFLKEVFENIKEKFQTVLVEEYFEGEDFRFLVLDDKVLAVARRVHPFIVGDGRSKISELVEKHNVGRGHDILKLGFEVDRVLKEQNLNFESIPQNGEKILLRRNANIHTGGIVENVSDLVHPKFKEIAIALTRLFALRFSGVDIICPDISNENSNYTVVEINTDPGYDLHWMDSRGQQYDATEDILDSLMK